MADGSPRSDLAIRTGSAIVMLVVIGLALWFGGLAFKLLVLAGGVMLVWEWKGITDRFPDDPLTRRTWLAFGFCYVALAVLAVLMLYSAGAFMLVLAAVIATDIGAYFAGRTIGGPKIAPAISPSKTWAGLGGGMIAAALVLVLAYSVLASARIDDPSRFDLPLASLLALSGALIAIVAQVGDFFESWAKRRAGVKDSGHWIPGHGGLFDRVDGLLLACLVSALLLWLGRIAL
jgi:phosphatidate cytidylyltransferase